MTSPSPIAKTNRFFYNQKLRYVTGSLIILIFSMALAVMLFFYEIPLPEDKLTLSSIEFSPFEDQNIDNIPAQSWTTITLPDDWRKQGENRASIISGWYRHQIELDAVPVQPLAILIASPRMNVAVYINHNLLGQGGRFTDPVARNWWTPLLFSIPSDILKAGKNTLHIYLKTDRAGIGYLPELHLAPHDSLIKSYDTHYLFRITSVQFITLLLFVQGSIIGILWYLRKHEVYYGYYAVGALLWSWHNLNIFTVHIPVSNILWDWFSYTTLGLCAFIYVIFVHRFFEKKAPNIERVMIIFAILCSGILYFLEGKEFHFIAQTIWYPAAYLAGIYGTLFLAVNAWKYCNTELQIITISAFISMLYAGHDILILHGIIDWKHGYFFQYAALILLPGFTTILLYRFVSALNETENLNRNFDQQLEKKHAELESNHQKIWQLENERARLILDMHDGIGGNLVSTLALIELRQANMQQVAEALRDTLDEIRLMIDSIDIQKNDLTFVLGIFRTRITRKLRNSQIELEWDINDIPSISNFDACKALFLLRILQEAITSAIKKEQVTKIRLSAYLIQQQTEGSAVIIEICDNGKSLDSDDNKARENMHDRARGTDYKLFFESGLSGTTVKLILALDDEQNMLLTDNKKDVF
ncbi:hypothetical protein MNBD_GAMMA16-772 [hydrothermal vent metagenome]|uniref:histidine kinase n=1 Tax=hydrothermal vent metagenome TaxID=652676 RepID=A0A3B0Z0N6_9ZZZZ